MTEPAGSSSADGAPGEPATAFSERRTCPFCERASSDVLVELRYHEVVGADTTLPDFQGQLLACRACGVAYPSHVYGVEHFASISRQLIERQIRFHRSVVHRLRVLLLREILRSRGKRLSASTLLDAVTFHALLVPLFDRRPPPLAVLDVGAGFGDFAEAFRALGNTVETTEIVPDLVDYMRGLGFRSHLGELERISFDARRFDLIFMRGTLYRTRDPATSIEVAKGLLAEDGVIACLDTCPGAEGTEYWFRMQFPQGQFYVIDRERYRSMLRERFGLAMDHERLIYGRPETHLVSQGLWGTALEFVEMLLNNVLRRKPFVMAYSLRPLDSQKAT